MTVSVPEPPALEKVYRTELSPVSFLRRSAFVYPDKVAVVHGERRYSYREFHERVNRLASALAGAGVEAGDRVAFLCPNIPALLEAHFAVPAAGAVLVAPQEPDRDSRAGRTNGAAALCAAAP
jgi:fatty-acyl-CoA synthase